MSKLFEPIKLGAIELPNRIVIAPMCQYSAQDGCMTDWHLIHLGHLAMSGAALLTIEATAVSTEGRITYADVGLYSTETEASIARTIESIRRHSPIAVGIQLGHAGRKASTEVPWLGGAQIAPDAPNGWTTVAPSAIPFASGQISPVELTHQQMKGIRQGFVGAAQRAVQLGIDLIQLHAAHGYLLHQFLSPISNRREDEYGGSYENRIRFPLEVFDAVREAVPPGYPVSVRVSGTDWIANGWTIEETATFCRELEKRGCAAIHVSSGGLAPEQKIPIGPSYQVPLARAIKSAISIPVVAVGLITEFEQAEAIVSTGDADFVALARGMLYDPRWPWHAAAFFGERVRAPKQYLRSEPGRTRFLYEAEAE